MTLNDNTNIKKHTNDDDVLFSELSQCTYIFIYIFIFYYM
jgi:hypothetical protein